MADGGVWTRRTCLVAALACLVTACVAPTSYAPARMYGGVGYSEIDLGEGRYRVSFSGNSLTPAETVDAYLLRRAAELTLADGYDHFVIESFIGDVDRRLYSVRQGYYGATSSRDPVGATTYRPGLPPGEDNPYYGQTQVRHEVAADIVMGQGPAPEAAKGAFDARAVLAGEARLPPRDPDRPLP